MEKLTDYLWVGLGSALGGMSRFWLAGWIDQRHISRFPWGTLVVNVSGCLVMGCLAAWAFGERRAGLGSAARLFLLVGFLGGYTTFSAFSWQTLQLMRAGNWLTAGSYIAGSLIVCLLAVALGHWIGESVSR